MSWFQHHYFLFLIFIDSLHTYIPAVKKAGHLNIKAKMASEYYPRVFAGQPIRARASKLFLYGEYSYTVCMLLDFSFSITVRPLLSAVLARSTFED